MNQLCLKPVDAPPLVITQEGGRIHIEESDSDALIISQGFTRREIERFLGFINAHEAGSDEGLASAMATYTGLKERYRVARRLLLSEEQMDTLFNIFGFTPIPSRYQSNVPTTAPATVVPFLQVLGGRARSTG